MMGWWDFKELRYPTSKASGKVKHHSGGNQVRVQQGWSKEGKGTSAKMNKGTVQSVEAGFSVLSLLRKGKDMQYMKFRANTGHQRV